MKRILAAAGLAAAATLGVASANALTVTSNPLWTDTGISLSGETVCITAAGEWSWQTYTSWFGPEGDPVDNSFLYDEWLPNNRHGQLIAFVGDDPYAGRTTSQTYYSIGSSGSLSGLTGELWLGFNDDFSTDAIGDNGGSVEATITRCTDGGSTFGLLGGALALMGWMARRRN